MLALAALTVLVLALAAVIIVLHGQVQDARAIAERVLGQADAYQANYNRMYEATNRRLSEHIVAPIHRG